MKEPIVKPKIKNFRQEVVEHSFSDQLVLLQVLLHTNFQKYSQFLNLIKKNVN